MRPSRRQLALDLRRVAATGRDDFLVSSCNAEAVAWIDRWPEWPGPALVLSGPAGSGKSHLAEVWRARSGAQAVRPGGGPDFAGVPDRGCLVIDDADRRPDDVATLHLYNTVAERGGSALVTVREPPARWTGRLPDLVSRLEAATTVRIGMPDEALVSAVIVKMLDDQGLDVPEGVLAYALARMELSFEAAEAFAAEVNRASLQMRRELTVPLAREALGRLGAGPGARPAPPDPPDPPDHPDPPGPGAPRPGPAASRG